MLNYTIGGWQYTSLDRYTLNSGYEIIEANAPVEALNHWKKPGELAINPRVAYKNDMKSTSYADRFLHRMTNIRLRNIALTQPFSEAVVQKTADGGY
ncbi:MAG: hypothetical protein ACLUNS_10320 [Alistipes shahii]